MKLLAAELGYTAANLYAYAKVAEVWNQEAFEDRPAKSNKKGFPLSFSHFVELASVDVGEDRNALMRRALEENMSVADFRLLQSKQPYKW